MPRPIGGPTRCRKPSSEASKLRRPTGSIWFGFIAARKRSGEGRRRDRLRRAREKGPTRYIGYSGDGKASLSRGRVRASDSLQVNLHQHRRSRTVGTNFASWPPGGKWRSLPPDQLTPLAAMTRSWSWIIIGPIGSGSESWITIFSAATCSGQFRSPCGSRRSVRRAWCIRRSSERKSRAAGKRTRRCSRPGRCRRNRFRPFAPGGAKSPTPRGPRPDVDLMLCRGRQPELGSRPIRAIL